MTLRGVLLAALPLLLFAQHEKEGDKSKHPFIGNPAEIEAGRKLFANGCAACHGVEGQGGRGPNLRERVVWHPLDDDAMFKAIDKGIGGGMPPANLPADQVWRIVAYVRSLTSPAIDNKVPGDASAGEKIFWASATGCSGCHAVQGRGGKLGPDLGNIAATRSAAQLRESILDPDANGAAGYKPLTVTLKTGKTLKGVARNRSNYSLQLQDATGEIHLIPVGDVRDMNLGAGSPMPKDYAKKLAPAQLNDLIAYLARLSLRPAETAQK
ncbi:MAG: c-type cytochrome [Acidobacteria bacterium]|nr:c-type cytochrome [Acidobacteriota bacterium]